MTLTQLVYILAVQRTGSFRRAAEECYVTQPTLSMQIQKLEDYLGIIIFDRSQQPIKPTLFGEKILLQSQVVVQESKRIDEMIKEEKQTLEGDLHLGIIPTLAPYILPIFLENFTCKYPKVKLIVEEMETALIVKALKRDQLDGALLATPLLDDQITESPLFWEPFYIFAPHDHPVAKIDHHTEDKLPLDSLLLLHQGNCLRDQVINLCELKSQQKKTPHLQFESGSLETLIRLVEKGLGYTILPELATYHLESKKQGVIRRFSSPPPVREISLVWHRSWIKENMANAVKNSVEAVIPPNLRVRSGERKVLSFSYEK